MDTILMENKLNMSPAFVKWNVSYEIGIAGIDQQHFRLISLVNELGAHLDRGETYSVLASTLDDLAAYAQWHFKYEEELFVQYGYPWSTPHKADHQIFIQKLNSFIQVFKAGVAELTCQIITAISNWLKTHIIGKDKTYGYFFITRGMN
jgi:hemerythrin